MNEELNDILKFYEEEKESLEHIIKSYIEDFEYKAAYFHSKGLKKVNQKIQLLKNLIDPNSDKLEQLLRSKNFYDIIPHPELRENTEFLNYLNNQKLKIDNQINFIKNTPKEQYFDGQEFDDLIFSLVENQIKCFRFYLNKESNLYLDFKKLNDSLVISIANYDRLKKEYILHKSSFKALKGIGFKKDKTGKSIFLVHSLANFKNSMVIKTLTSRIIYDGIGYYNINNATTIEIIT
jgi:hypothetical protein